MITVANNWLGHRASFFALQDVPLGNPIDWYRDYSSGKAAPARYSGLINIRDRDNFGDVKYIWELNRLQHLVPIALAAVWTGNAKYWAEIEAQLSSWRTSNPFMVGVNWKSPLEAGLRLISFAYVSFLADTVRAKIDSLLRETVYYHQYFIRKFYSKYSSANNHLIGEMAGLYVASVFWPFYRESSSWRTFARRKLIEEMSRQIEGDGVGKERAIEYQLFVLELFLLAGALGEAVGEPFPQEYWNRITRMAAFLSAVSNRVGGLPMFGDGDSGEVIGLPEAIQERSGALIGIGQGDETSSYSGARAALLFWGQTLKRTPTRAVQGRNGHLESFSDGGYYVLTADRNTENETVIVFDAGPLGLPPLWAHGHADALSFWLSYGGREFLIDPGTYCYHGMSEWRAYFRGTGAHNTVRVDHQDQSVSAGPFLWRQAAQCWTNKTDETDEFVEVSASHDGYCRLRDPVKHTRTLRFNKKSHGLMIVDRLECQAAHELELLFHFSEHCEIRQVARGSFEALNRDKRISLGLDSRLRPELYRACESPIFGWVSRRFGVKEPSFTIVARAGVTGTTELVTHIAPVC